MDGKPAITSLQEQWSAHRQARERLIAGAISTVNRWIAQTTDPEIPGIGRAFAAAVKNSGCREDIDIHHNQSRAVYISFDLSPRNSFFANHISYGPRAEEDLAALYSSMVHEKVHAIQKSHAAALHASPFNRMSQIIICPRDWITVEERCEQDAYARQAWFNSLIAEALPEIRGQTRFDALSTDDFESMRNSGADINDVLPQIAKVALTLKSFYADDPGNAYRFEQHYQDLALSNFIKAIDIRAGRGEGDFIFVRIEPEDIAAIGSSCGVSTFGAPDVDPAFLSPPVLHGEAQEKLAGLNRQLGIYDESSLPTLTQALAAIGMTRAQFIAHTYSEAAKPAGTPCPQPGLNP